MTGQPVSGVINLQCKITNVWRQNNGGRRLIQIGNVERLTLHAQVHSLEGIQSHLLSQHLLLLRLRSNVHLRKLLRHAWYALARGLISRRLSRVICTLLGPELRLAVRWLPISGLAVRRLSLSTCIRVAILGLLGRISITARAHRRGGILSARRWLADVGTGPELVCLACISVLFLLRRCSRRLLLIGFECAILAVLIWRSHDLLQSQQEAWVF